MEALAATSRSPWPARRLRAERLRERHPFAAEVLTLYLSLLDVQEPAFEGVLARPPASEAVPRLALDLLPRVVEATVAAGPRPLADAVVGRTHGAGPDVLVDLVGGWLRGDEQAPVDRFLARAATAPFLEALPDLQPHPGPFPSQGREARCPRCGGPPQLSYVADSAEPLVTGPRRLVCARCAAEWVFPRLVCAGCGEETSSRLPVYSEAELFPHLRIDGCETCHRYLLGVDTRRDAAAVPVVDELAALPLDLYAREHGLLKVVPNLMGF
jgi:FdhE protein